MVECDICGSKNFTITAGFHFCVECGTQLKDAREIEHETLFIGERSKIKVPKPEKEEKELNEPTTWEEHNYILIGLVDELITIGAKDELNLTALQVWSAYLKKIEAAFFSKKKSKLPRLAAVFKKKDAKILYNFRQRKRKRSRSKSKSSAGSTKSEESSGKTLIKAVTKNILRKIKKSLTEAEYDRYNQDSLSINLSGESISTRTTVSNDSFNSIPLKYSRHAKRLMKKKKLNKEHIREHENDLSQSLNCHTFRRSDLHYTGQLAAPTRATMYGIVYIALNQIDDTFQLGDLIRFLREGHVTHYNVSKFFPENINRESLEHRFRPMVTPSHSYLRSFIGSLARELRIQMVTPDLNQLCKRYVEELCLPIEIYKICEVLLSICPPKMPFERDRKIPSLPNYEARAMAYIIFVLKLLFGLDDEREEVISLSATQINKKLNSIDPQSKRLFVWNDWVKFIEMRNIILCKCHYPTTVALNPNTETNSNLYIEYLIKMFNKNCSIDKESTKKTMEDKMMENIKVIFQNVIFKYENFGQENTSMSFAASVTPHLHYLNNLLKQKNYRESLNIPEFMFEKHQNRDIVSFLRPNRLKKYFSEHKIKLIIDEYGFNSNLQFEKLSKRQPKTKVSFYITELIKIITSNESETEWLENIRKQQKQNDQNAKEEMQKENDDVYQQVMEHLLEIEKKTWDCIETKRKMKQGNSLQNQIVKSLATQIDMDENVQDIIQEDIPEVDISVSDLFSMKSEIYDDLAQDGMILEPRRDINDAAPMFNYLSSGDEENDDDEHNDKWKETLTFDVTNFDYWIKMFVKANFFLYDFDELAKTLPKNFRWLLKQCAMMIENFERDLYLELIVLENYFAHVLEPLHKISKNQLLYQDIENYKQFDHLLVLMMCKLAYLW